MVMKMNKTEFVKELSKRLGYDLDKCEKINSILEDTFIFGKNAKETLINKFTNELNVSEEEANKIYNVFAEIFATEIKNKI